MQLQSLVYGRAGANLFSVSYGYTQNGGNNGQITSISDHVDAGRSVSYSYDPLGRLSSAVTTGSVAYPKWGLAWSYDRYGNRTAQTVTAGSAPSNAVTVSAATNRITDPGYLYDASGNMTADGLNTMVYDAENRVVSVNSGAASYTYDGNGLRVKKVAGATTTEYIFSGTKVVAEYANGAAVTAPTREYIYSGSALLATIEAGATRYHMGDHLSARLTTDSTGAVIGQQGHFPFGESWYASSTTTKWQFTSYERYAETGNDYAIARYHVNRLGRFSSPDPLAGSIADPQSLNRYAYVLNNPVNFTDPLGLVCYWDDGSHDDAPEDGGDTREQCEEDGGTWIDPIATVVDVVADGGGGGGVGLPPGGCADVYVDGIYAGNTCDRNSPAATGDPVGNPGGNPDQLGPFAKGVFDEVSRRLAPVNKLSDCTGKAVANQVPFGKKLFGAPNPHKAGSILRAAGAATGTKEAFIHSSAKVVLGLSKAGLPALSEAAENGLVKLAPVVPKAGKFLGPAGYVYSAYKFVSDVNSCYQKP